MKAYRATDPNGRVHRFAVDDCKAVVFLEAHKVNRVEGEEAGDPEYIPCGFHVERGGARAHANFLELAIVVEAVEDDDDQSAVKQRAQEAYTAANAAGADMICEALQSCLIRLRQVHAASRQRGLDFTQIWGMVVHHARACGSKHGIQLRSDLEVYRPTADRIRVEEGL